MCDLSGSLHGPDPNHVIHNVTSGLEDVMGIYKSFMVGIKRRTKLQRSSLVPNAMCMRSAGIPLLTQ